MEVPLEIWNALNKAGRGNDRAAAHARARERDRKKAMAVSLRNNGKHPREIADYLNVPLRTVYRWTKG